MGAREYRAAPRIGPPTLQTAKVVLWKACRLAVTAADGKPRANGRFPDRGTGFQASVHSCGAFCGHPRNPCKMRCFRDFGGRRTALPPDRPRRRLAAL